MERIMKFRGNKEVHLSKEDGKIVVKRKTKEGEHTLTFQATQGILVVKINKGDILVHGMLPAFNDCLDVMEEKPTSNKLEEPKDNKKPEKGDKDAISTGSL